MDVGFKNLLNCSSKSVCQLKINTSALFGSIIFLRNKLLTYSKIIVESFDLSDVCEFLPTKPPINPFIV